MSWGTTIESIGSTAFATSSKSSSSPPTAIARRLPLHGRCPIRRAGRSGSASAALSLNVYAVAQMFAGPRAAGTWVGFQNALGNVSGIVCPIVTGIVVQRSGYDAAFLLTAAVAAAGAVWWAFGVPRIEQVQLD